MTRARFPGLAAGLLLLASAIPSQGRPPALVEPLSPPVSPWAGETPACSPEASFALRHEGGALHVSDAGRPVLAYSYGLRPEPGVDESYRRSSYVHPLYGPDGEVLTADFPADHRHHRGLYWAWPGRDSRGSPSNPAESPSTSATGSTCTAAARRKGAWPRPTPRTPHHAAEPDGPPFPIS